MTDVVLNFPVLAAAEESEEVLPMDPGLVPDTFATGVSMPEFRNGHVRITCYADRDLTFAKGQVERVVTARIVFAVDDFLTSLRKVQDAAARGAFRGATPH